MECQADATLRQRVAAACVVAAEAIRVEPGATNDHANRLLWAKKVFASPTIAADSMVWAVLAQNKAATKAQILSATDASLQTAVDAAVAVFV
ncbi:hypothetical protein [Methylibium sp.]|uniref:hypothetical protein n=1 Tax=Methylibium sp. TaxID=2067992 RepID=UPI001817B4B0|nr:hypothetical protein [Methylibium sp.]MBA3588194.1 hypothetical protein [Methylibium sp.]